MIKTRKNEEINLEKLAGEVIRNLQENATNIFSKYSITSTRSVGDTIQNYLGDKCFPELLKKYSVTDVVNHTGSKDFSDITFTHGGIEYVIDVKTQRENTKFNMPNITSLERIKKFYTNKKRVFLVLIVRYLVKNDMVEYKECFIQPIENISWKSLIISGLGNGQIQIKNANDIEFNKTSRKNWMNNLYNEQYKSVPMVFQSYSSFKWMTVIDNVTLPMVLKGMNKKYARELAMEALKLVGLEEHATKYAKSSVLSGGQLQRVSIARCLTSGSEVFFLDEATGALDIKMKREIQDLIIKIASETEHTIINVTHSLEEALYISNKIFILQPNPCSIYKEMDINYGNYPRGRWIFETEEYRNYNRELGIILDNVCK